MQAGTQADQEHMPALNTTKSRMLLLLHLQEGKQLPGLESA